MNIIRVSKNFFIIDGVPLKLELDTDVYESCKICYYNGFNCDMEGHVLCNFLKISDNDLNGEFHLQPVKSLILISKIRNDKDK